MSRTALPPARILVVDDEPSNVRLLERMLELFGGLEWRCTSDPREAIPMFAEFQFILVKIMISRHNSSFDVSPTWSAI